MPSNGSVLGIVIGNDGLAKSLEFNW